MSEKLEVATLSELELPPLPQSARWATVRQKLGISSFGVNAWTGQEPGQEIIGEHDELGPRAGRHEELYVVLKGTATFTVDGKSFQAPTGTFVFVRDRAAKRKAVAAARARHSFPPSGNAPHPRSATSRRRSTTRPSRSWR